MYTARAIRCLGNVTVITALIWSCQTTPDTVAPSEDPIAAEPPPPPEPITVVAWPEHEFLDDADLESLREALHNNLQWVARQKGDRAFTVGPHSYTAEDKKRAFEALKSALANATDLRGIEAVLLKHFQLLESADPSTGGIKSTGYYVPTVAGSFEPNPAYPIPVYGTPDDLVTISLEDFGDEFKGRRLRGRVEGKRFVPYWERSDIRGSKRPLKNVAKVIAWVKEDFDIFNIEIQGSGYIRDKNGKEQLIHYADQNGRPYRAIGSLLLAEGKIPREKMSMQAIRTYLKEHPKERSRVLNYNPSFVFFNIGAPHVTGNMGVPLTAGRSIAADQRFIPPGTLAYLTVERPAQEEGGAVTSSGAIHRFVFTQDTGGAIRGPGRIDFYWGSGEGAEEMAGLMQHQGRLLLLAPKSEPLQKTVVTK